MNIQDLKSEIKKVKENKLSAKIIAVGKWKGRVRTITYWFVDGECLDCLIQD